MKKHAALSLAMLSIALVSCSRHADIKNIDFAHVPERAQNFSHDSLKDAIIRGASKRGWICAAESKNKLLCHIQKRQHKVSVYVIYDNNSYRIVYNSSTKMNAKGNKIHPKYNKWVQNLNDDIQYELSTTGSMRK